MMKKIFFLLIYSYFLSIFFLPKKVWACSYNSNLRICLGTCTSPSDICQLADGGTCSCVPIGGGPTSPPSCLVNGKPCTNNSNCCSGYCADGWCANLPPTATATPTQAPLVCDTTLDGCYPLFDDGCESTCDSCPDNIPVGVSIIRTKSGDCYSSAACRNVIPDPLGPCYTYENLEDSFFCGYCTGGEAYPTPTPFCQPFRCYDIPPQNSICPGFTASQCSYGLGNCDNCGGMDCGSCSGVTPPPGPTPTPGCTENCLGDPRRLTTCYNVNFGICNNTQWCIGGYYPITPNVPTCSNIGTTVTSMPVNIGWTSGGAKASFYEYQIDVGATKNTTSLSVGVTFSTGGTHTWKALSVNNECSNKTRSAWSSTCSLCYEKELCTNQCGQTRNCNGNKCTTGDLGTPAVPIPIWPISLGTTIACDATSIDLSWSAVNDGLADGYAISLRHQSDYNKSLSWNTVGLGITGITIPSGTGNTGIGMSGNYKWYLNSYNNTCNSVPGSIGTSTYYGDPWAAGWFCKECESCSLLCGQSRDCGGKCPVDDTVKPGVPVKTYPLGINTTSATILSCDTNSIDLTWNSVAEPYTGYNLRVGQVGATNTYENIAKGVTSKTYNIGTSGVNYWWDIRSYNFKCLSVGSTIYGDFSTINYFCKECEQCTKKCGQAMDCNGLFCANTDNGGPDAPTTVSPTGTSANPAVFLIGSTIKFDWSSNSDLTEYYRVLVKNIGNTLVFSDFGVTKPATERTFGPFNTSGSYYWYVDAVNTDCGVTDGPNSVYQYFRINSAPTIVKIQVANSDGTLVPNDNPTNNHICKSEFTVTTKPREVVFGIFVNDPDGVGDLGPPPILHWNGQNYQTHWTGTSGGGTNNNAQVGVSYPSINYAAPQSLHEVTATYSDRWGTAVGSTSPVLLANRLNWKVWDCQVPVSGTLYNDLNQSAICTDNWSALPPLSPDAGFNALRFTNTSTPYPSVVMSVPNTNTYSSLAGSGLVWGKNYISVFNNGSYPANPLGDLLASSIKTKIADLGKNPNSIFCPTGQTFDLGGTVIDPYSSEPRARIVFSFIEDQESWYQVLGAGVKSRGGLEYGVPVTAPVSSRSLTLGNSTPDNGLVSGISFTNTNGNNENEFGLPNNWWVMRNTNDLDSYNYNYFYNNFLVKAGVGVTGTDWGAKPVDGGIYFVKNDLSIDSNFILANPNLGTMMVIVNGDINIAANVTRLDGIYMADGNISVGGTNVNQLNINGMLYAGGSVELNRGFTDKTDNNTTPAVKVNYSPGLIFNLPPEIMRVLSGWREE